MEKITHTNDANFDNLFYHSPQPMLIFDIGTLRILEVNEAAVQHYGYTREEFLNYRAWDLRVQEEKDLFDTLAPHFRETEVIHAEGQHLLKSGKVINVQIVSYIIEYKQKKCRLAHIHDVTRMVKQAHNLEILLSIGKSISEELKVGSILQKVIDATTQLSGAEFGLFLYKDSTNEEILHASNACPVRESASGKTELFRKLTCKEVVRIANVSGREDYRQALASLGYGKNGCPSVSSFMLVPVYATSKEIRGCLLFGHSLPDVFSQDAEKMVLSVISHATVALENAALFQALLLASKEKTDLLQKATEQNFKKDEFLSVASHELKTPVTSMKGYLQILEKQIEKGNTGAYLNLVEKANRQVNKIVHLVTELLNLSKLEAGKLEYNFSEFEMADVLNDCISVVKNAEVKHKIRVFGDPRCRVYGDRNRLEQVIINLLDNAIKYSPEASEVLLGLSQDKGFYKVEIRDFGPGISEEKLSLIFERYYRGEENSYKTSGLGLGLFIASEIIKRHQGRIGVESEFGKGSTFWFAIPVRQE